MLDPTTPLARPPAPGSLSGRIAVVTGGGRGIGAATARALAAAGATVIVAARTAGEIDGLAAQIRKAGGRAIAVPCDVVEPTAIRELARRAAEAAGPVSILVNNAGVASSAPLPRVTLEEWSRLFAVNVTGTFLCTQAFLPAMLERGWGRVVNIASVAARAGFRYISAYAASKHAVLGFTRSVAAEVAARGVTVNAVCPGYVDTELTSAAVGRIVAATGKSSEETLAALLAGMGQRRLITPEEVAGCVLWLCDEHARGVNGQALVIDGGGLLA